MGYVTVYSSELWDVMDVLAAMGSVSMDSELELTSAFSRWALVVVDSGDPGCDDFVVCAVVPGAGTESSEIEVSLCVGLGEDTAFETESFVSGLAEVELRGFGLLLRDDKQVYGN